MPRPGRAPRFPWLQLALGAALLLAATAPARAATAAPTPAAPTPGATAGHGGRLDKVGGHLGLGYAKLLIPDAPGGSFALAAGLDYPVAPDWKIGGTLGYELLGSRTVERGSLFASVDYSLFEAVAFAHWQPPRFGPVGRISLGPGLFSVRADLSTAGGGAMFSDLARGEVVPGIALDVTLVQRKPAPVRVGLELGARSVFLTRETWTLLGTRVAFHY